MAPSCVDSEWGRVAVAGSGFMADGYDLYIIGQVERVLAVEFECSKGTLRTDCLTTDEFKAYTSALSSAALFGAVVGQLLFGTLADRLGRRFIFITTACLIIIGSFASACVMELGGGPGMLLTQLVIARGLLGFGIGGEYPLSATICAEGTAPRRRGTLMSLVFANQGLGYLLSAVLMLALAYAEVPNAYMWRIALAFGGIVPMISLYFRMQMHESEDYTKIAAAREAGDKGVDILLTVRRYAWHLVGTAGNWFLFDIVFYANSLFNAEVTSIIRVGPGGLKSDMLRTLIIVLIMLPGYFVGVALINKLGRKNVQIQGYANMILWFSICGFFFPYMRANAPALFLIVYGLTFFFSNFGANLTTYVIPGEIYPTQAKATLHGMSAASGKMGAFVGSIAMPYVTGLPATTEGLQNAFFVCAGLAAAGLVLTIFLTPRYGPNDLIPEKGETVAFAPLYFQRKTTQKYWADKDGVVSSSDDESEAVEDTEARDSD